MTPPDVRHIRSHWTGLVVERAPREAERLVATGAYSRALDSSPCIRQRLEALNRPTLDRIAHRAGLRTDLDAGELVRLLVPMLERGDAFFEGS